MNHMCKNIYAIIFLFLWASCTNNHPGHYFQQLCQLDSILDRQPDSVLLQLKSISPSQLEKKEKAYYYLLQAAATDKSLNPIFNDSTLKIAEHYYKKKDDFHSLARTQYYLSKYQYHQKQKEEAYKLLKQAEINLSNSDREDIHLQGLVYYQLGNIQNELKNLCEAETFIQKALEVFKIEKDTISSINATNILGNIYIDSKDYNQSQIIFSNALEIINNYSGKNLKQINEIKGSIFTSLSFLYRRKKELKKAVYFGNKSLTTFNNNKISTPPSSYFNLALAYFEQNKLDSAEYYSHFIIDISKKQNKLINLINGYKLLSDIEEQSANYKEACEYKDTYNRLKDSLNSKTNKSKVLELEKQYDLSQKEGELLKAENTKLRLFVVIVIIIACLLILWIHSYYRHKKLKARVYELTEEVKHTEWGFSITKELIVENHNAYDELERLLNRHRLNQVSSELYQNLQRVFEQQKNNYSARLISTLTNFDNVFIKKFQKKFPELNSDDVMIAAMLRHQWKTNDISTVFHVSTDAIRKRKDRLKNKMMAKLKRKIELEEYLRNM